MKRKLSVLLLTGSAFLFADEGKFEKSITIPHGATRRSGSLAAAARFSP
jgi:hypothetical protein